MDNAFVSAECFAGFETLFLIFCSESISEKRTRTYASQDMLRRCIPRQGVLRLYHPLLGQG
jgi:hypothetical protein